LEILFGIIACEALVQLWFCAAPLQAMRRYVVVLTPFLYSSKQETHLVNCKYCMSVWVGVLVSLAYFHMNERLFLFIVLSLSFHRLSNFLHLVFSYLRDKQVDLRVERK
jgi:hypothetical protein